jgi:hypothetical protein
MKYRNRKEATAYLRENGFNCGDFALAQMAVTGEGPQFRYWGSRVVYTEDDLDAWIEARLSAPVRSRSELNAQPVNETSLGPPTRRARRYRKRRRTPQAEADLPAP